MAKKNSKQATATTTTTAKDPYAGIDHAAEQTAEDRARLDAERDAAAERMGLASKGKRTRKGAAVAPVIPIKAAAPAPEPVVEETDAAERAAIEAEGDLVPAFMGGDEDEDLANETSDAAAHEMDADVAAEDAAAGETDDAGDEGKDAPASGPVGVNGKPISKAYAYMLAMKKLGATRSRALLITRANERIERILSDVKAWPEFFAGEGDEREDLTLALRKELTEAVVALTASTKLLERYPADWKPVTPKAHAAKASTKVAEGSHVVIREKLRAEYDGVMDAEDLNGLKVEKIVKAQAVCRTGRGERVVLKLAHLALAPAPEAKGV